MSNTIDMSEYTATANFTVAIDADNKIIWCSEKTTFDRAEFKSNAGNTVAIYIGKTVTDIGNAFLGLQKIKRIYVYSDEIKEQVNNYFASSEMLNGLGETISVSKVPIKAVITQCNSILPDTSTVHVSDFGAKGNGRADDTASINLAIAYVVYNGGKLLFNGDATYFITSPIKICPPGKEDTLNENIKNFDIDFNNCRIIAIDHISGDMKFDLDIVNNEKGNSMIYVYSRYADEERIGIIQNVQLDPGVCLNEAGKRVPAVHTGMYLEASPQISYKNIKICNTTRGVYIGEDSFEIFMDNIHMSKSHDGKLDLSEAEAENEALNDYKDSKHIGIDCRSSDCHFSNIVIVDYLVGMRMLNGDNRVYGAHIWNTYCPNMYKKSVGFINSDTNYYTNCVVDHFYIGWLAYRAVPFYLTNCHWIGKEIDLPFEGTVEAYAFYLGDVNCSHYSGGGIYATDCHMVGSDLDNENCFTNFCNRKDNDIHYSGEIINTFGGPIPGMKEYKYSENNKHDCENNSTINQYGKIKSVERSTKDINKIGTISLNFSGTTAELLDLGTSAYGYKNEDVICVTFRYNITGVTGEGNTASPLNITYGNGLSDNFELTDSRTANLPFPSTSTGEMFAAFFKVSDSTDNMKVNIERSVGSAGATITELRLIKMPANWKFPKYYLESEEKYKTRILKYFKEIDYSNNEITIPICIDKDLAFMTLPFKYTIKEYAKDYNPNTYKLSYSTLGRPCFNITTESNMNSFHPALQMNYSVSDLKRIYCTKNCMYKETNDVPNTLKFVINDHLYWNYELVPGENVLYSHDFVKQNCNYDTTMELPAFEGKTLVIANMINNPYGYHFESPIDSKFHDRAILASFGTENLVFEKGTYKFTLNENNALILSFVKIDSTEENISTENSTSTDKIYEIVSETYSESGGITNVISKTYGLNDGESVTITFDEESTIYIKTKNNTFKVTELTKTYNPISALIPLYVNGEIRLMMKNAQYTVDLPTALIEVEYSN